MQKSGAVFTREIESIPGSLRADIQGLRAKPGIVGRTGRRGEIEQVVDFSQVERLADVLLYQGESGLVDQSGEVGNPAGGKVVDTYDVMALGEESIAKMRAKEAGGAGDQDTMSRQNTVSPGFEVKPVRAQPKSCPNTKLVPSSGPTLGRCGFDRGVLGGPAYTEIGEAQILHDPGIEKIAAVNDDGVAQGIAKFLEVQTGELGPVGKDQ